MRILNTVKTILLSVIMILSMINPAFTVSSKLAAFLGVNQNTYINFKSDFVTDLLLGKDREYVDDESAAFAEVYLKTILLQVMVGNQDPKTMEDAFNSIPHSDSVHNEGAYEENNVIDEAIKNGLKDNADSILPDNIRFALQNISNGIYDVHVYYVDTAYEGVYQFAASYYDCEGNINHVVTGVFYDSNTGCLYGHDNKGIFGVGFDFNLKEFVFTTPTSPWQRALGYNIGYDILGDIILMDCNTVRIKFQYGGVDRMVQMWKGNYTKSSNGAEIGMYCLKEGNKLQYSAIEEDEELPMSMILSANGQTILNLTSEKHWWLAGFKLGSALDKNDMTLDFSIDFRDEAYANAFSEAAQAKGITIQQNGSVVNGSW